MSELCLLLLLLCPCKEEKLVQRTDNPTGLVVVFFSPALTVRFITRRFIGDYDPTLGRKTPFPWCCHCGRASSVPYSSSSPRQAACGHPDISLGPACLFPFLLLLRENKYIGMSHPTAQGRAVGSAMGSRNHLESCDHTEPFWSAKTSESPTIKPTVPPQFLAFLPNLLGGGF